MKICKECNTVFLDEEVPTYEDDFGFDTEVGWKSHKQTFIGNCSCGGEIVEAKQCSDCYEWFAENELYENDLCFDCKRERELEEGEKHEEKNDD